jgi:hypothetical protein
MPISEVGIEITQILGAPSFEHAGFRVLSAAADVETSGPREGGPLAGRD